jgi:YqjK-like protein
VSRSEELLARRARLVQRAAEERDELAALLAPWEKRLGFVDRGVSVVRAVRSGMPWVGAGLTLGSVALGFANVGRITKFFGGALSVLRFLNDLRGARRAGPRVKKS